MIMNLLEQLHQEAENENIEVLQYSFQSDRIKGLYCDGAIALNNELKDSKEKACVLSEELGHHYTTIGHILDQRKTENRKQELRARAWAYNKMIGLMGIVRAYENRCSSFHEMAEFLDVTEEFLSEALEFYKNKYGISVEIDNYVIFFEPYFGVLKMV